MTSIFKIELPLQRSDDARDIGAVVAAVGDSPDHPVGAALAITGNTDHSAAVHVRGLPMQIGNGLDALDQQGVQLLGGAGWLGRHALPDAGLHIGGRLAVRGQRDQHGSHESGIDLTVVSSSSRQLDSLCNLLLRHRDRFVLSLACKSICHSRFLGVETA